MTVKQIALYCSQIILVFVATNMFPAQLSAQHPQLSQPYSNPLFLNPSLCGETKGTRLSMNYRNQWAGVGNAFRTFAFGVDHFAYGMRSGIGFSAWRDVAGINNLAYTHLSGYFSHKIKISTKQAIKAGIRVSYVNRSIDQSRMLFADQVIRDDASASIEPNLLKQVNYPEVGIGFLYYSENWWTGVAFGQLNQPNNSLLRGGEVPLPIRYSLHGGFLLYKKKGRQNEAIKMAYEYKSAQQWDQFDIGINYRYQKFLMGMLYRGLPLKSYQSGYSNHDAIILLLGMETDNNWRFGYSYDMTISKLTVNSGGSHEISLSYEWPNKTKRKKIQIPPCMQW